MASEGENPKLDGLSEQTCPRCGGKTVPFRTTDGVGESLGQRVGCDVCMWTSPIDTSIWPHDGRDWVLDEAVVEQAAFSSGTGKGVIRSSVRAYLDAARAEASPPPPSEEEALTVLGDMLREFDAGFSHAATRAKARAIIARITGGGS